MSNELNDCMPNSYDMTGRSPSPKDGRGKKQDSPTPAETKEKKNLRINVSVFETKLFLGEFF